MCKDWILHSSGRILALFVYGKNRLCSGKNGIYSPDSLLHHAGLAAWLAGLDVK